MDARLLQEKDRKFVLISFIRNGCENSEMLKSVQRQTVPSIEFKTKVTICLNYIFTISNLSLYAMDSQLFSQDKDPLQVLIDNWSQF